MIAQIIGAFVIILVGVALFPTIQTTLTTFSNESNVTGASSDILGLSSLFFVVAIVTVALVMVYSAFKNTGMGGNSINTSEDSDEEDSDDEDDDDDYEDEEEVEVEVKKVTPKVKFKVELPQLKEKDLVRSEFD